MPSFFPNIEAINGTEIIVERLPSEVKASRAWHVIAADACEFRIETHKEFRQIRPLPTDTAVGWFILAWQRFICAKKNSNVPAQNGDAFRVKHLQESFLAAELDVLKVEARHDFVIVHDVGIADLKRK